MWVGTYHGGINYYHSLAPAFDILQHSIYRNSLSDNTVSCIVEDPNSGNLWIGTNDGGLNYYNRTTGHFTVYSASARNAGSLRSNNIKCVYPESDGTIYVGVHDGGLSHLNVETGRIEHYNIPDVVSIKNSCYALMDGEDGTLWVGSMDGLYRFDKRTKEVSLHPLAIKYPQLKGVLVTTLFRDSRQRIWIGTEESLYMYAGGEVQVMVDSAWVYSIGLIQALCIQEDSHRNIWVGTSSGLYRYKEESPSSWEHYSMADGLPNDYICGILEDKRGRLWLTTNRGLACFSPKERNFCNYTSEDGLPHSQFMRSGACQTKRRTFLFWEH